MWDEIVKTVKKRISEFREEFAMWQELRKVIKPDCRQELFWEFLMNPQELRNRHAIEKQFQRNMNGRWK